MKRGENALLIMQIYESIPPACLPKGRRKPLESLQPFLFRIIVSVTPDGSVAVMGNVPARLPVSNAVPLTAPAGQGCREAGQLPSEEPSACGDHAGETQSVKCATAL